MHASYRTRRLSMKPVICMGSNLEEVITSYFPDIGYFHIADFPGRHEAGTGSADWGMLFRLIQQSGCTGYDFMTQMSHYKPSSVSGSHYERLRRYCM